MGYPKKTLGYYFYNRSEGKVFIARNGIFLEKEFLKRRKVEKSRQKVYLEEIQDEPIGQDSTSDTYEAEQVEYTWQEKHHRSYEGRQDSTRRARYYCWTVMSPRHMHKR
jgi:hypothetical protein